MSGELKNSEIFVLGKKKEVKSSKKVDKPELTPAEQQELASLDQQIKVLETKYKTARDQMSLEELAALNKALDQRQALLEQREPLPDYVEKQVKDLEAKINSRFERFDIKRQVRLNPENIELPKEITKEHLTAIYETFGEAFNPDQALMIYPGKEDFPLDNPDFAQDFLKAFYPETAHDDDQQENLISYRPSWFKDQAEINNVKQGQTWQELYLKALQAEQASLGGHALLYETTVKPQYEHGSQHYGHPQGTDSEVVETDETKDPLLPLFREVFGDKANRFSHSWADLHDKLLPQVQAKLEQALKDKGLPVSDTLKVILRPVSNLPDTLYFPQNSQTDTWEWTNQPLLDKDDKDTGRRLSVGDSDVGGAGVVGRVVRDDHWDFRGARLAVVL